MDFELHLQTDSVEQANPAKPLVVAPEASVRAVIRELRSSGFSHALVCQNDRILGIFTERDALRLLANESDLDVPITTAMTPEPAVVRFDVSLADAISLMTRRGVRRLPIVDSAGKATGVLEAIGVAQYLAEHFPRAVYTLPPAPHHKTSAREGA